MFVINGIKMQDEVRRVSFLPGDDARPRQKGYTEEVGDFAGLAPEEHLDVPKGGVSPCAARALWFKSDF